jgi:hypothetical protein
MQEKNGELLWIVMVAGKIGDFDVIENTWIRG